MLNAALYILAPFLERYVTCCAKMLQHNLLSALHYELQYLYCVVDKLLLSSCFIIVIVS